MNLEHPRTYNEKVKPVKSHDCDSLMVQRCSYRFLCLKEYVRYICMDIDYSKPRCLVAPIDAAEHLDREFHQVRVNFGSIGGRQVLCYASFTNGTRCEELCSDGLGCVAAAGFSCLTMRWRNGW